MRERGFMPFSVTGIVILMLVVAMVGQAVWLRHQRSLNTVNDISSSALLTLATSIQNDVRALARYAVYDALWEVSINASGYQSDGERKAAIESLAARYFLERLTTLPNAYEKNDSRIKLDGLDARPTFNLREEDGGYVFANVRLPKETRVKISSWDNDLVFELPFGDLEVFVDSRYFMLQRCMQNFIDGLSSVGTSWATMEYVSAWAEAWLGRKVSLNLSRSRTFFELAWAEHELSTFGSTDYLAIALGLGATAGDQTSSDVLDELSSSTFVVTPLRAVDLETMNGYIESALGMLGEASAELRKAKSSIDETMELTRTLENSENFDSTIEDVREKLGEAAKSIERARGNVARVARHFQQLIDFTAGSAGGNVVMVALHESLVEGVQGDFIRGDYPSPAEQVEWGVSGIDAKLARLGTMVNDLVERIVKIDESEVEILMAGLCDEFTTSLEGLLAEPIPKRWVEFDSYTEPGGCGSEPSPKVGKAPVYLEGEEDGTLGAFEVFLQNIRKNFDRMSEISRKNEPSLENIRNVEIDEALVQKLELNNSGLLDLDRERLYELLPPPPIRAEPGLSVFHEFKIEEVKYRREDPAGLLGSSTPTPIPLWFIGVTLWWAQWDVTLELEGNPVEEIFDFENPTLPRTHEFLGGVAGVHKPLAYRYEVPTRTFNFRLVLISLRPFSIGDS